LFQSDGLLYSLGGAAPVYFAPSIGKPELGMLFGEMVFPAASLSRF
jgi:hypothetical protein